MVAPPGAGKTTLLARVAETFPGTVAWCTVGPEDRTGTALLDHLATAVAVAVSDEPKGADTAVELLDLALEAIRRRPGAPPGPHLLMVLDDVHELAQSRGEHHLAELVRWRPDDVRLLLGTRRTLGLNTPRLLVAGEALEVDAEALRFRSWEVEELFQAYGEPLSPEAAAALTRRTGGWAAGLKLFQLATAGKPRAQRERAVAELGGRSRLLRAYLTRTVLDDLPADRRAFLLRASTLGTLTGALCDALLDREGSSAVLEDLAARQFFLTPAEDGSSFRFHQVLQTLLEGLLVEEVGGREASAVYARSAALLEAAGLPTDAARAYALAEDFASVARIVQQTGAVLPLCNGEQERGGSYDDPWLALAWARRLQRLGSWQDAVAAFRRAESLLDDAEFLSRCSAERAALAMWTTGGNVTIGSAPPRTTSEAVRLLTRRVVDPATWGSPLVAGLGHLLSGDPRQARPLLERVPALPVHERLYADLAAMVVELVDDPADGRVWPRDLLLQRLEQLVMTADVQDQPWMARVARGLQAAVLVATGADPWRVDSCGAVVEECVRVGDDWGATLLAGCLGSALAVRDQPGAVDWLDRAAGDAERLDAPVLRTWLAAVSAALAVRGAIPDAAHRVAMTRALARSCGLGDHIVERVSDVLGPHRARPPAAGAAPVALPPQVHVRCLGSFVVAVDGRPVTLPVLRPLPRSLLLMLAVELGREVHREVLIDRFWPDAGLDVAVHRLHAAASTLRKALVDVPGAALHRQGEAYQLVIPDAELDVAAFETALRAAARAQQAGDAAVALTQLRSAVELYRGDLLPETGPAEWVVAERDRLRVAAAAAAWTAADLARRSHPPDVALPWARRATELDPLRQSVWLLLAEVQAAMGDDAAAARSWRTAGRVEVELGR